jgi:predicted nucleic acid-binding protein
LIVATDSNTLIYALKEKPPTEPDQIEFHRRAQILLQMLAREKAKIIIPSIVLAEYLIGIEASRHPDVIASFQRLFFCPPFDVRCAAVAASLWQLHHTLPEGEKMQRRVLKADVMIIATAKVAGARMLFTGDRGCRNLARNIMDARDLPTHDEDLYGDLHAQMGLTVQGVGEKNQIPITPPPAPAKKRRKRSK